MVALHDAGHRRYAASLVSDSLNLVGVAAEDIMTEQKGNKTLLILSPRLVKTLELKRLSLDSKAI